MSVVCVDTPPQTFFTGLERLRNPKHSYTSMIVSSRSDARSREEALPGKYRASLRAASRVLSSKPCCRASGHDSFSIEGHRDRTPWSNVAAGLSAAQREEFDVSHSSCGFYLAPLPRH